MNFGIFHTAKNVYPDVFEELLKSDYVDVFLSEGNPEDPVSVEMAKEIAQKGKKLYVAFFTWIFRHVTYQKMVDVGEGVFREMRAREGLGKNHRPKNCFFEIARLRRRHRRILYRRAAFKRDFAGRF